MMKKLLASSLLAAFLVFSGAALAHPAGQDAPKKSSTSDKDKDKDKKGTKGKGTKKPAKKAAGDTSSPDKKK
jgi:hypothetical protein